MEMKKILTIVAVAVAGALAGCEKDRIAHYGETEYIYFSRASAQVLEYSFAFNPNAKRDTLPLVVRLIGKPVDQDRTIGLEVDAEHTTAQPDDYTLPTSVRLRAGRVIDTIALVLHHSDRLMEQKYTLRLRLVENEHFELGPTTNAYLDVLFSDIIARPSWWTTTVANNFLGPYSDAKYRLFIEATGVADMSDLSENEQRAYAIIFRDFLASGRENGNEYKDDEIGQINVSPNLT